MEGYDPRSWSLYLLCGPASTAERRREHDVVLPKLTHGGWHSQEHQGHPASGPQWLEGGCLRTSPSLGSFLWKPNVSIIPGSPAPHSHARKRWLFTSFPVLVLPQECSDLPPLLQMVISYLSPCFLQFSPHSIHLPGLALASSAERFQGSIVFERSESSV